jgi:hypothetical protein
VCWAGHGFIVEGRELAQVSSVDINHGLCAGDKATSFVMPLMQVGESVIFDGADYQQVQLVG